MWIMYVSHLRQLGEEGLAHVVEKGRKLLGLVKSAHL